VTSRQLAIYGAVGGLAAAALAGGVLAFTHDDAGTATANPVVVNDSACALSWAAPASGRTIFTIENTSPSTVYSVQLLSTKTGAVYGKTEMVAPSTEVPLDVVLPPGSYAFQCQGGDGYTLVSPAEQVKGAPVTDAHPYVPVSTTEIQIAVDNYRASLMPLMKRLEADTDRLSGAVHAGQLSTARTLWLPAHLDYSRLGVAYDTFGNFNDEINGRPLGLVGGVHNPQFQGFLRLEYGLWHGQSQAQLDPVASKLDVAVHGLVRQFPSMPFVAGDLALRAHEILENTLQFELTGETDMGSNTNLATASANVQGTMLAVAALHPLLHKSDPKLLANVDTGLSRLQTMLLTYRHGNGSWTGLTALTTPQRERLDSATSGLLEQLELIPDRLEPSSAGGEGDD